jgi:predicted Zn-dependent peptidase
MRIFPAIIFAATLASLILPPALRAGDAIPNRPEKLIFPPLNYQPPNPADYRVQLKSGPVAYVIPDRNLPLVTITVYIHAGRNLEPASKKGVAELTGWLLAHGGAGTNTADQMEERLAFLAADFDAEVGEPQPGITPDVAAAMGKVSLNLLSKDVDEGLGIIRDVLYAPRFQDDKIRLRQEQMLQEMERRNDDSVDIEARERSVLAYGQDFWVNHLATSNSLESITRADIETFHQAWFAPQNFVIAVSGDFDRDRMVAKLENTFGNCPVVGETPPLIPTNTIFAAPGVYLVDKPDVNQGRVSMMLPGIRRDDPDYFDVMVMNDILGGGGLTSRIFNRVRSDEGLAYSIWSRFPGGVYYPLTCSVEFQSKSRTVAYAASLCEEEMKKICAAPVTDTELNTARRAFIERFPHSFETKAQTADLFAQDEFAGRYASDPQFWENYRAKVAAVTAADVQRVAQKYLTPDKLAILVVGNKADILLGYPGHPVKLSDLGNITELPLPDPLTLQPAATAPAK